MILLQNKRKNHSVFIQMYFTCMFLAEVFGKNTSFSILNVKRGYKENNSIASLHMYGTLKTFNHENINA